VFPLFNLHTQLRLLRLNPKSGNLASPASKIGVGVGVGVGADRSTTTVNNAAPAITLFSATARQCLIASEPYPNVHIRFEAFNE
jgi:hypothetical protein